MATVIWRVYVIAEQALPSEGLTPESLNGRYPILLAQGSFFGHLALNEVPVEMHEVYDSAVFCIPAGVCVCGCVCLHVLCICVSSVFANLVPVCVSIRRLCLL